MMGVSLYTSRLVLNTLGVEDFGIYGVVGGVVGLFSFLNASMSGATSRFLTFEIGRGNIQKLKETFCSALNIHIGIALFFLILAETVGLWFVMHKLVIPEGRMTAALWVYQFSILSMIIGITQVPYNASIIAHERMNVYAYVEIINVILKLLIVYLLVVGNFDKLVLYGILLSGVSVIVAFIYRVYCLKHFDECKFSWIYKPEILKPMFYFSGWDLYGNVCGTVKQQGTTVLLNLFFGTIVNASASLASTIIGSISLLSLNVVTAFRPQIIKTYADNNIAEMQTLVIRAIKFTSLLLMLIAMPVIVEMPFVLTVWLKNVPDFTVGLSRIAILTSFFVNMNAILLIPCHATGNIKIVSFVGGTLYLLNIVVLYLFLKSGATPYIAYALLSIFMLFVLIADTLVLKKLINKVAVWKIWGKSIFPICGIALFVYLFLSRLISFADSSWLRMIIVLSISTIAISMLFYLFVFTKAERVTIRTFILKKLNR